MTVLVVGEALIDVVARAGGERTERVGGSPLNVAVGLARLGVPTTFASQVGDDQRGRAVKEHVAAAGAAFVALDPSPRATSTAVATLSSTGNATYEFEVDWNPTALPDLRGVDAVHVGSLGAVLSPGAQVVSDLVATAAGFGIPVSFDPNVRLAVEPDVEVWRRAFALIAPQATHLKMSDEDAETLFPGIPPAELATSWASDGLAVVTCGADGSHLARGESSCHVPAGVAQVVDTIGAGDSYTAAVLAWFARRSWRAPGDGGTDALMELGSFAAAAAAITCSRPGADPPWAGEVDQVENGAPDENAPVERSGV